ncbi:MAG: hypothetical protein R3325_04490 [Thermoanaerobaculia bacterium]|nr:hypothetical protein [Thermoanaerobaculia bacterium]
MSVRRRFGDEELEAARRATVEAERQSGVEIVAVVVDRCDAYHQALWMAATLGALAAATVATLLHLRWEVWGGPPEVWILLPPLIGAAAGYLAARVADPVRRLLVPGELLERRARRRAAEAFVEEQVFDTVDRTGVLILVALLERRAVVLADRGLAERVGEESWQQVTAELAEGMRRGRPGPALAEAVRRCGRLAAEAGLRRRDDDANELGDRIRFPDDE